MQVNLHGSLCKLLLYFYTVMVIEKKRNLAQSPRKYAILTLRLKKFFWGDPSPCEEEDTPFPHPTALGASSPRLGSRLWRSTFPPATSTPGSAYGLP